VTRPFYVSEVVCDHYGRLLAHKDGNTKYESTPKESMAICLSSNITAIPCGVTPPNQSNESSRQRKYNGAEMMCTDVAEYNTLLRT